MRKLLSVTALGLMACTSDVVDETASEIPIEAEVSFETPVVTEADRTSLAAPYVLANGALSAQISPDGAFVAMMSGKSGERQIYVSPSDGSNWEQITDGSGVTFFDVLPSGDILYGSDNNGDERENYFLWNAESKAAKLILPATEKGFRSYGAVDYRGQRIAYASTERNGLDFDIYVMDLESGKTQQVYEGEYGNFVETFVPGTNSLIISESVGEDSDKLFVLNMETGKRRVLSDPTPRANHTNAGIIVREKGLTIVASNKGAEFKSIRLLWADPKFDNDERTVLEIEGADIESLSACRLITVNRDGFSELMLWSVFSTLPPRPIEGLPDGVYSVDCERGKAVIRVSGPDTPGDIYFLDISQLRTSNLSKAEALEIPLAMPKRIYTSNYGELDKSSLITPDSIRMPARDGVEVQGLLYMPESERETKPPVVFLVHGGPTAQARPSYNATVQYLLSRGIAVFQTNVRGSTGFGRTYTTLDDREKRLDSIRDLVDMLESDELAAKVDTDRAAVVGGSYGGYAVNAVLSEYPDAFVAGVSLYGVADWVTALEIASPALKASDLIEYGDISDPKWRKFYTKQSPIRNADKIKVPVLFSHGAMDPRIDIAETEVMVRALRANGIDAPYIRYPDEGHGWRKLDNQLTYQRRQAEFLEEVLGVK